MVYLPNTSDLFDAENSKGITDMSNLPIFQNA